MTGFKHVGRRAAVLVSVVAIALAGCGDDGGDDGDSGGQSDKQLKIAAFILASANTYSQANLEGVKEAAKEAGNVTVRSFDGAFDPTKQANQIQDAVAAGDYDGFVVFPNAGALVAPPVEEAAAAGIETVSASAAIGPDLKTGTPQVEGVIGTVWHENRINGENMGKLTVQACEEEHADSKPCKVAFLTGGKDIGFEQAKLEAYTKVVEDAGIELVAVQEAGFLQEPALKATQDIVQANPDLDVLASSGDQMTLGAEQAIDDAGVKGVTLIGNGATEQGAAAVKEGRWYATPVFMPKTEGKLATLMLIDSLRGKQPSEQVIDWVERSPVGPFLTKDNVDQFKPEWSA
jgi:ribose transport system substrate-binding protein